MADLETRVDHLEGSLASRRLLYDSRHGVDRRDPRRFLGVWALDATGDTGERFGSVTGHHLGPMAGV